MIHYTSFDGIKSILGNATIKFSRLDLVDDITESQRYTRLECTKYTYISCWTNSTKENIALWHMYSTHMTGFCIKLPKHPFVWSDDGIHEWSLREIIKISKKNPDIQYNLKPIELYKIDEMFFIQCIIVKNGTVYDDEFLQKMEYIKDFYKDKEDPLKIFNSADNIKESMLNRFSIARKKDKDWKFQKEVRYILQYTFLNEFIRWEHDNINIPEDYKSNQGIMPNSIMLKIHKENLNKMIITAGPKCSDKQISTIEKTITSSKYSIRVNKSKWSGLII